MKPTTVHVVRASESGWTDRRTTDSMLLACVEHLIDTGSEADRVILIAGEEGECRAASLGLRTPHLVQPRGRFTGGTEKAIETVLRTFPGLDRLVLWSGMAPMELARAARRATGRAIEVATPDLVTLMPQRVPSGSRLAIREAFGLHGSEYLLALASDPPDALAAHDFVRACALVALVGRSVTAIVPRHAPEMERAKTTLRTTGVPVRLITSETPVWTLLPACDGVVVDVQEGSRPRHTADFAQRWMAATAARLGIAVAWPGAADLGNESMNVHILKPQSRLPVHVARAFNEFFLARDAGREKQANPVTQAAVA